MNSNPNEVRFIDLYVVQDRNWETIKGQHGEAPQPNMIEISYDGIHSPDGNRLARNPSTHSEWHSSLETSTAK